MEAKHTGGDLTQAQVEARMLSGEPFTYSGLCGWRVGQDGVKADADRLIDRTIQKLRRKGLIAFQREGRETVWRPTAAIARATGAEGQKEAAQ